MYICIPSQGPGHVHNIPIFVPYTLPEYSHNSSGHIYIWTLYISKMQISIFGLRISAKYPQIWILYFSKISPYLDSIYRPNIPKFGLCTSILIFGICLLAKYPHTSILSSTKHPLIFVLCILTINVPVQ